MRPIKKGQNGNPDSKPGKAKQILFEKLSSLPGTVCDVLNGHVLCQETKYDHVYFRGT